MIHLRYGSLNHPNVPVEFRIELQDKPEGVVEGGLFGVRLSLVEFVLKHGTPAASTSTISKTSPKYENNEPICISDDE